MKVTFIRFNFLLCIISIMLVACKSDNVQKEAIKDAKPLKEYGVSVKVHEDSKAYFNIYSNHGNDKKLNEIAKDYLGKSFDLLNVSQKNKEFKPDYIEYEFEVDELPLELTGLKTLFSKEDRVQSKGKRENVVIEFVKRSDRSVRSQHTIIVDFPLLANSEEPKVTYGFNRESGSSSNKLHIKKLKTANFNFQGTEQKYFIGATKPLSSQTLNLKYDGSVKKYIFETEAAQDILDMDRLSSRYKKSKEPLFDDMRYAAIVSNLKSIQNKYIKSGGYYNLNNVFRTLSSLDLNADFPLRDLYKGEALMKNIGSSLADGKSYVKLVLEDTQIVCLLDVDGYVTQYQQVTVDKEKGIVDKIVLVRK